MKKRKPKPVRCWAAVTDTGKIVYVSHIRGAMRLKVLLDDERIIGGTFVPDPPKRRAKK